MAALALILSVCVGLISTMAAVHLYDYCQRLETRIFLLEHELEAFPDRGMK